MPRRTPLLWLRSPQNNPHPSVPSPSSHLGTVGNHLSLFHAFTLHIPAVCTGLHTYGLLKYLTVS